MLTNNVVGASMGRVIFLNLFHSEAPSRFAASYKSSGMF